MTGDLRAEPLGVDDLLALAGAVPHRDGYPTVDELLAAVADLADAHELVTARRIGTSRLGEPIGCVTVGDGARRVVVVGGVHPNEPVGSVTVTELVRLLAEDAAVRERLDATWHVVPCIDPDGMRLNESWFADPRDRVQVARGFYRPAPDEQAEWSFPWSYRDGWFDAVMPETVALMRLIDEVRPHVQMTLHNSELGGAYFYLNREVPGLPAVLGDLVRGLGLPLHTGEPEIPGSPVHGPAVFGSMTIEAVYEHLAAQGADPVAALGGASSSDWASRHGTLSLVAEAPQWTTPEVDDDTPAGVGYADAVKEKAVGLADLAAVLGDALDAAAPHLRLDTPFRRATEAFVPLIASDAELEHARAGQEGDRPATVAELFGCRDLVTCFRLRYGHTLLRALAAEVTAGTASAELRRVHTDLARTVVGWESEAAATVVTPVPPTRLAGLQLATLLATVERAR